MRRRAWAAAALALCAGLVVAMPLTGAQAKKKSAKVKTFNGAGGTGAIPQYVAASPQALKTTLVVPKKYKGKTVGDLNVTSIRTTGSDAGAANDLVAELTAPGGRTVNLFSNVGTQSIGPWTLDDDSEASICPGIPPAQCPDSTRTLSPPFAGTSNLIYNFAGSFPTNGPLATFDGVKMNGTWTLTVFDTATGATNGTSSLDGWGLRIVPAKPIPKS